MIDPEEQQNWPTLDFLANKEKKKDARSNKKVAFPTRSARAAKSTKAAPTPASTAAGPSIPSAPSAPSTPETKSPAGTNVAKHMLNDVTPKPTSALAVEVDVSRAAQKTEGQKQQQQQQGNTSWSPKHLSPAAEKTYTPSPLKKSSIASSSSSSKNRSLSRTSSISHADWAKKNSPRRSTMKPFLPASKVTAKGIAFIPGQFEGLKDGYMHRSGLLGKGYYLDTDEIRDVRKNESHVSKKVELHPSLQGMGLSLQGFSLRTIIDDSDSETSTRMSKREIFTRAASTMQVQSTSSTQYRQDVGNGIYGPEDADWLTRRLAEQYRQEQIGHGETLAAAVHRAPTTRGVNTVWNTLHKKSENNLSYYERLHETSISGSCVADASIAGSWLEVMKSKSLDKFLPRDDTSEDSSSYASSMGARPPQKKARDFGFETDWLRTPTHGVTGKHEYTHAQDSAFHSNDSSSHTKNEKTLHEALRHDTEDSKFEKRAYITHSMGMARACKGSNSVWNTTEPKSAKEKVFRKLRNPKPTRLSEGLDRNREILQHFLDEKDARQSPQQARTE